MDNDDSIYVSGFSWTWKHAYLPDKHNITVMTSAASKAIYVYSYKHKKKHRITSTSLKSIDE